MARDFKLEKRLIVFGLLALVGTDVALVVYRWKLAGAANPQQELSVLTRNRDLSRADIDRANKIRANIPAIQKDCDHFEESLLAESTGYSAVSEDLSAIAAKAGLVLESRSFRQSEIKGRGLTEVVIEASVNGSYGSVVRFLNGLQRSQYVYAVDALSAKSQDAGTAAGRQPVRVGLHIHTYFRSV